MKKQPTPTRFIRWIAVLCTFSASTAAAQPGFQVNRFRPSEQTTDGFATSGATTQGHLNLGAQLYLEYNNDPLQYQLDNGATFRTIEHQLQANLDVSLGITERLTVFLGIPLFLLESGDSEAALVDGTINGDAASGVGLPIYLAGGFSIGDPYLGGRVRLFGDADDVFVLGVQGRVTLPVAQATDSYYAGERTVSAHPELLLQINVGVLQLMGNAGVQIRRNTPSCNEQDPLDLVPGASCLPGTSVGDELTYGLGASIGAYNEGDHELRVILEAHGRFSFQDFAGREETLIELLGGAKYRHASGLTAGIGGGPNLIRGIGAADFRVFGMVGYAQRTSEAAEVMEEPVPEPREGDADGDGMLDGADTCAGEPEDLDGFQDEDGCPDPDNDGDGIRDRADTCPNSAEDLDGYQDTDGCPELDNDGDGVADTADSCPQEPGPSRNGGCPWADTDGDGIIDPLDTCVMERGSDENHGCPEPQLAYITESGIEILETVYFQTNRDVIQRRSFALLDNVAALMGQHPEVRLIRVEGHTDARGRMQHNMRLSQRRAEAVMRYLVQRGVESSRLIAQGYGPTRPLVADAQTPEELARNRRVEFHIAEGQ